MPSKTKCPPRPGRSQTIVTRVRRPSSATIQEQDSRCQLRRTFVVLAYVVDRGFNRAALFELDPRTDDDTGLFAHLIIVTILVERSIEVWHAIWQRAGREKLELALEHEAGKTKRQQIEQDLKAYRARTRTLAMYLAFVTGSAVALAGVNILGVSQQGRWAGGSAQCRAGFLLCPGVRTACRAGSHAGKSTPESAAPFHESPCTAFDAAGSRQAASVSAEGAEAG